MDGGAWWAAVHGIAKSRTRLSRFTFMHWRRKWQPTPVFLPGESQGRQSLVGCHLWGRTESDRLKRLSSSSSSISTYSSPMSPNSHNVSRFPFSPQSHVIIPQSYPSTSPPPKTPHCSSLILPDPPNPGIHQGSLSLGVINCKFELSEICRLE